METKYDLRKENSSGANADGTFENDLFAIDQFVSYPTNYLRTLAKKIRISKLSRDEMIRTIELVNMDTYILHRALALGVHPITGNTWYRDDKDAASRVERMVARNNRVVIRLKEILREGELNK